MPTTPIYCRYSGIQVGETATVWPAETSWTHHHPIFGLQLHQLQKLTQKGNKTLQQRNLLTLAYCHACLPGRIHQQQPASFSSSFLQLHFYPITSILPALAATPADHAVWLSIPHIRITGTNPASNGKQLADWLVDCVIPAVSTKTSILETIESRDTSTLTNLWLADHTSRKAAKTDTLDAVWNYALQEIRTIFGIPATSIDGLSIALFRSQLANPTDGKILDTLSQMLGGISAVASSVYSDKLGISTRQIDQARIDLGQKQAIIRDRVLSHQKGIRKLSAPIASIDLSGFSTEPAVETLDFSFSNSITVSLEPVAAVPTNQTALAGLDPEILALLAQKELATKRKQEQRDTAISRSISTRFGDIDLSGL